MLEISARIEEASGDVQDAEQAYRRAAVQSGGDAEYWSIFARFLVRQGRVQDGVDALNEALDLHPADPLLNYSLAQALERLEPKNDAAIRRAYEYAVAEPVRGFMPELDYAIYLYLTGAYDQANRHFRQLRALTLPYRLKSKIRKWSMDGARPKVYEATVGMVGFSSSRVRVPDFPDDIFMATEDLPERLRRRGATVRVHVGFNAFGLRASSVETAG